MVNRRPRTAWGIVLILAVLAGGVHPGHAQKEEGVPKISNAELLFEEGISAFERGRYETAYERFQLVSEYELNRKTTAALVMGGKALIRLGRYQDAIDRLRTLLNQYPETSYREEATSLIERAQRRVRGGTQAPDTLRIGVALPMGPDWVSRSQALFNGLRLAVDGHNGLQRRYVRPPGLRPAADTFEVYDTDEVHGDSLAVADGGTTVAAPTDTVRVDSLRIVTEQGRRPERLAKMHFRRTGTSPETARAAVDSLVRIDEVDVILGPIRSKTARPAGARAEEARVPLVAPVATDPSVSAGRDYVFQANPTIPDRGRIMAQFAKNGILLNRVGIIYEQGNSFSARMAEGFEKEAARLQSLEVPLTIPLKKPRDWSRLPTLVEEDSTLTDSLLAQPEAFYLPVAGQGGVGKIQGALRGMRQMVPEKRALGNGEWHNLPFTKAASAVTATYTNSFYVQTERAAVQRFVRRYRLLTGTTLDELSADGRRLAYAGYDVAHFLLSLLSPSSSLTPQTLRTASTHEGLGMRIGFKGENRNQSMFIHRYRGQQVELLR